MTNRTVRALVILLTFSMNTFAEPWVIGTARSSTTGEELYRELHTLASIREPVSGQVDYVDPSGELIARKSLDYDESLTAPAVDQIDLRSQTRFFSRYESDTLTTGFQRGGESARYRTLTPTDELIIDAGFDSFVRHNWMDLQAGRSVNAHFYVPSRLETLRINIVPVVPEECSEIQGDIMCLEIRPAGLLRVVGWFLDPLQLAYGAQSRQLLLFKGTSNLADNEGKAQQVVIHYSYADDR